MKKTKLTIVASTIASCLLLTTPLLSLAGEIQYATVTKTDSTGAHIIYKGPSGSENFFCPINSSSCADEATTSAAVLPFPDYETSPNNHWGIKQLTIALATDKISFYSLYDFSSGQPTFSNLIPFYQPVERIKFSNDESAVIFFSGTMAVQYDIASRSITTTNGLPNEYAFLSLSPSATWLSSYNYVTKSQGLWNLKTATKTVLASTHAGPVEFSADETKAAYTDNINGFTSLVMANLNTNPITATTISNGQSTVADYIFAGNTLFYTANESAPYQWALIAVGSDGTKKIIDSDVSYGQSLVSKGSYLYYGKINGKNSDIVRYDAASGTSVTLNAVAPSSASANVVKTATTIAGRNAVLWAPVSGSKSGPLFIWLHGGPERQTSLGYHSYLSYAVYDELLERLVDAGSTVVKLDYTGSYSYGQNFIDALKGNIGKSDVADVINTISAMKQQRYSGPVYLIGNSYGGYLALRTLVQPQSDVDGAVSINGVTDWWSLLTRIPSSPFTTKLGTPTNPADIQNFLQASIISRFNNITNQKVVVLYGQDDADVPIWQSTDFYNVTKALGKNVIVESYANEDHIPRQRDTLNNMCSQVVTGLGLSRVQCQ